jgi:hypothetical protein
MINVLVARGGLSIATLNNVVAIGGTLLPHPLFHWYEVFVTPFVPTAHIATPNDYANSPYCNALFGSDKQ